jgi:hypothetical protein
MKVKTSVHGRHGVNRGGVKVKTKVRAGGGGVPPTGGTGIRLNHNTVKLR